MLLNTLFSDDSMFTPIPIIRMEKDDEEIIVIPKPIPKPRMSRNELIMKAVIVIQRWWREKKKRRKMDERKKNGNYMINMEYTIDSLIKTATLQAECCEKLEETVNEMREVRREGGISFPIDNIHLQRINSLETCISSFESLLTPLPPSNLSIDHTNGVTRLKWSPPPSVDLYELIVNGKLEGSIRGISICYTLFLFIFLVIQVLHLPLF